MQVSTSPNKISSGWKLNCDNLSKHKLVVFESPDETNLSKFLLFPVSFFTKVLTFVFVFWSISHAFSLPAGYSTKLISFDSNHMLQKWRFLSVQNCQNFENPSFTADFLGWKLEVRICVFNVFWTSTLILHTFQSLCCVHSMQSWSFAVGKF